MKTYISFKQHKHATQKHKTNGTTTKALPWIEFCCCPFSITVRFKGEIKMKLHYHVRRTLLNFDSAYEIGDLNQSASTAHAIKAILPGRISRTVIEYRRPISDNIGKSS